jgi:hypothetical protein
VWVLIGPIPGGAAMDEDILSQGDDRPPSPWPRRLGVIAAVVAVAVGGIVYLTQPGHGRTAASAAHPTPATSSATPASNPAPTAPPLIESVPDDPNGIIGDTVPWEDSLRLPVTGRQPAWYSPATGRSEAIGGLPADGAGYQFTRVGGGWAVQADAAVTTVCGDCAGPPRPVWFLADGAQSATPVGTADLVAPAVGARTLWLTSYPSAADPGTSAGVAREVSGTGALLAPPVRLPPGSAIDQGTDRGLLLTSASEQAGMAVYTLWNPASPTSDRAFDDVIAASATEIAWTSRCAPTTCRVQVLDLATGRQTAIALPARSTAANAAFSPSGAFLALQLSYGLDGALAMRLDVASVAVGRLTAVPGTSVSSDALFSFGWPSSGDSLVAEFNFMPIMQLASWHPGASRLAVTVIQPGPTEASLIVG